VRRASIVCFAVSIRSAVDSPTRMANGLNAIATANAGSSVPGVAVRSRAATASKGPKKLFGRMSTAFGSIASVRRTVWAPTVISDCAVPPEMTV
jgi:hypothetical protein